MPEYGLAVEVDKEEYEADPVGTMIMVRNLLKFNYKQFVNHCMEENGSAPFVGSPVRIMGPQVFSPVPEGKVNFAWYVNTDTPEQYAHLEELEVW